MNIYFDVHGLKFWVQTPEFSSQKKSDSEAKFKFMILTTTELPHQELIEHFDLIRVVPNV